MVVVAISFPAIKACGQCARVAGYWLRPGTNLNECGGWWRLRKKAKNFDHHQKPILGAQSHQTMPERVGRNVKLAHSGTVVARNQIL